MLGTAQTPRPNGRLPSLTLGERDLFAVPPVYLRSRIPMLKGSLDLTRVCVHRTVSRNPATNTIPTCYLHFLPFPTYQSDIRCIRISWGRTQRLDRSASQYAQIPPAFRQECKSTALLAYPDTGSKRERGPMICHGCPRLRFGAVWLFSKQLECAMSVG